MGDQSTSFLHVRVSPVEKKRWRSRARAEGSGYAKLNEEERPRRPKYE